MNANTAFTGSYTKNRGTSNLTSDKLEYAKEVNQSETDAADNCRLYVTTKKAMNLQDNIPSIPIDKFKDHCVLVINLTSMQDIPDNCSYPKLVGEPL